MKFVLKDIICGKIWITKLEFFISVAKQLQPFFAQVPDRCPNGSLLGAVIERPLANLDGPLHQERCPGAG